MKRPDSRILFAFTAIVIFFGVNFVAVRFSNRELPPFSGGAIRFALATAVLFAVVLVRGLPLPRGRALLGAVLYGTFAFGIMFGLMYWALVYVPAAMAAVIFSTIPLLTLLMAAAIGQERFQMRGLLGGLAALVGTGIIFFVQLRLNVPLTSLLAVFVAAVSAALSGIVVRGFPRSHPVSTNAVAMAVGTAILAVAALAAGERPAMPTLPATWIALTYLVASSTIAFVLMVWVLTRWTASATAYSTVLAPLVTVVVGAWLAGEAVTPLFIAGALVVMVSVYFGAIATTAQPASTPPATTVTSPADKPAT